MEEVRPGERVVQRVTTPLGTFVVAAEGEAVCGGWFLPQKYLPAALERWRVVEVPVLREARAQLLAYFSGALRVFDLPLVLGGTPFQAAVWAALREVPWGETTTYGALARAIGHERAFHAVGAAVGRNPLSVIVPCHRAVGKSGALTGYAGGLERKRWLLEHEAAERAGGQGRLW